MDPVTTAIITVLGKYAIDKGASLVKEAGQAAADAAGRLFQKVIDRLKADPAEARNAERFENNPQGYTAPISDAVEEKMKADPDFAAQLKALLAEFDAAQQAAGVTIVSTGSGDVFVGDSAFKVDTNVGTIIYGGSGNTVSSQVRTGGADIAADEVNVDGDVTGRDRTQEPGVL